MAAVADLVDADADQALEPALVEVIGDHTGDDPPDRVPADPQQAADRGAGHLLGQPRDDVLEVACVRRARPRPRHRLHPHPAVAAAQQSQFALDDAAAGAQVQMPPALHAAVVDLELAAGLPAARADATAAPQPDAHRHPLRTERDVRHAGARKAQQALECGGDAHVALPCEPLAIRQPAACAEGGGASIAFCATSAKFPTRRAPLKHALDADPQAATSPTSREETPTSTRSGTRRPWTARTPSRPATYCVTATRT